MNNNNFISKDDIIAVVGVSQNKEKYGYKVFNDLKSKGYNVYAVHKDGDIIDENILRYKSIEDIPIKPTLVVTVVSPEITEKIVLQSINLGIKKIWMQPGSESQKAIDLCSENGINLMYGSCIMVETLKNKE